MNGRDRVIATLEGRPSLRPAFMPITMQFAADLIGVKYREYATDHRLLVRGQIEVARRFGADCVSVISDPAVEAADVGATVVFGEDLPPSTIETASLLTDKARLANLSIPASGTGPRMTNRIQAVSGLRAAAGNELLVEGWIEGPCAEAADLRGLNRLMTDFYDDPDFVRELLLFVRELEIPFALAQIRAGADIIGVGDAASSLIGPDLFGELMVEGHRAYVEAIHRAGAKARLHICGNIGSILPAIKGLGYDLVDIDSLVTIEEARRVLGPPTALIGNLDPVRVVRNAGPDDVLAAVRSCRMESAGPLFVVGAGCEIPRDTPHVNMDAMRRAAEEGWG